MFAVFLGTAGIPADDVETVPIDGPDVPLVRGGQVDAAVNYVEMSPTELALQEETFQLPLADHGVDAYGLNVIASRAAWEADRGLVEGLTAAIVEGYRSACADRPAAARVFLELFPDRDTRTSTRAWRGSAGWWATTWGSRRRPGGRAPSTSTPRQGCSKGPWRPATCCPAHGRLGGHPRAQVRASGAPGRPQGRPATIGG